MSEHEHGAREREPPRSNLAHSVALAAMLGGNNHSSGLNQFSSQNISQQRKNDIYSEKQEAKLDKIIHKSENKREGLIDRKKEALNERTACIKAEYGSVENYNIFKKAVVIENNRASFIKQKLSLIQERSDVIKGGADTFFGKAERLKGINDKIAKVDGEIKTATAKLKIVYEKRDISALKANSKRADFLKNKTALYTEKPASLIAADSKIATLDGKIYNQSERIRNFSIRRESLLTEREHLKYHRAGAGERLDSNINSSNKLERKAARAEMKLDRANASRNLPQHRVVRKSYQFDHEKGKIKKKLILSKEVKPLGGRGGIVSKGLKGLSIASTVKLSHSLHGHFMKGSGGDDSAKIANTGAQLAERAFIKTAQHTHKFLQERPYKKVTKLQMKSDKANAKLYAQKQGGNARQMKKNAKQYLNRAKQARQAQKKVGLIEKGAKAIGGVLKKAALNPVVWLVIAGVLLLVLVFSMLLGGATSVGSNSGSILGAYGATDANIYAAVEYAENYQATAVPSAISSLAGSITHHDLVIVPYTLHFNPYALISFLTAYNFKESGEEYDNAFTMNNKTKNAIHDFINTYYYLSYGTSTYTDYVYYYDWYYETWSYYTVTKTILTIQVNTRDVDTAVNMVFNSGNPYSSEMYDLYLLYMETQGFRPDLFPAYAI